MRDGFLLYTTHYPTIQKLSIEEKAELLDAIFEYNINHQEPVFQSRATDITFSFLKQQFDRDEAKYQSIVERNRTNGSRPTAGRPPKEPKKPSGLSGKPDKPKKPDNDKDNDNGNDKEKQRVVFDLFRKQYPGTKRGLNTEYENFQKHHDHVTALPLLLPAIKAEIQHNNELRASGQFAPSYANLQTWINQRRWESELPTVTKTQGIDDAKPAPGYFKPIEFKV